MSCVINVEKMEELLHKNPGLACVELILSFSSAILSALTVVRAEFNYDFDEFKNVTVKAIHKTAELIAEYDAARADKIIKNATKTIFRGE